MKRRMLCLFAVVLTIGFSSTGGRSFGDDSNRRDGNWWLTRETSSKLDYLIGFLDGMDLGNNFSTWEIVEKNKQDPAIARIAHSYFSYTNQYIANVPVGQMSKGLDDFYSDYKNLRIKTSDGVWVVLKGISGAPKDQIESLIENLRRNAARE